MPSNPNYLLVAMLICISGNAFGADLAIKPGSAATFVRKPLRAAVASSDTTPPVTTAGPSIASKTDTTASLSATIDEYGTGYYLVQPSAGSSAPSATSLQSSGVSFAMTGNVAVTQTISGLTGATGYIVYFIAKDARNNVQAAVASTTFTTDPDTTPPVTSAGPSITAKTDTTATLSATINESGTGYYLAKLASAAAPTLAEVKAGTPFAMTANAAATASITGLTGATEYKIYIVAKDASNNWQTAYSSVSMTTEADTTPPTTLAGPTVSGTTANSTVLSATINEAGTGHYLVKLSAEAAPDVNTVRTTGNSFAMAASTAATPTITGLSASTAYKIYFVAKDTSNNFQGATQMVAVTTTADQCAMTAASAAVNTCCFSTNSVHQSWGRATTSFGSYYATGSFAFLGTAASSTSLKKTAGTTWTSVASCS